jgi:hypothetical protein
MDNDIETDEEDDAGRCHKSSVKQSNTWVIITNKTFISLLVSFIMGCVIIFMIYGWVKLWHYLFN